MAGPRRFRILTPDGLLSGDMFVVPAVQPRMIKAGCVLVVHERTGRVLTVHETRLFPATVANGPPSVEKPKSVCLKCGRVGGVIGEQVACPEHDGTACDMVEPLRRTTKDTTLASSG